MAGGNGPINSGNAILYAYCFYLGSLLPYLLKVTAWRSISRAGVVGAMLLGQFVLYWLTPVMMEKMVYDAVLSALVISFVLVRPTSIYARHLSAAPLVKLGDISYSFYALGQVTLAVVSFLIIPHLPFGLVGNLRCTLAVLILIGATLLIALPLSALSYRFIEMPWVAIGRRVAIARADQSS
jgi:peptidoglycan/LPS O-acetylase OafA/YrhL